MVTGGRILDAPPGTTAECGCVLVGAELVSRKERADAEVGEKAA